MSWSVNLVGKKDAVIAALDKESDRLTGNSKAEFDFAMSHIKPLIDVNSHSSNIELIANGHATWTDGEMRSGFLQIEKLGTSLKTIATLFVAMLLCASLFALSANADEPPPVASAPYQIKLNFPSTTPLPAEGYYELKGNVLTKVSQCPESCKPSVPASAPVTPTETQPSFPRSSRVELAMPSSNGLTASPTSSNNVPLVLPTSSGNECTSGRCQWRTRPYEQASGPVHRNSVANPRSSGIELRPVRRGIWFRAWP